MQKVRLTYLLVSGAEVHSQVVDVDEEELEMLSEYLKQVVHPETEFINVNIEKHLNKLGDEVEYYFNPKHIAGFRVTHINTDDD